MRIFALIMLIFACLWAVGAQAGQTTASNVESLFAQLQNSNTSSAAAKSLTKLGHENSAAKDYVSKNLPKLIEDSGGVVKTNSVELAGNLRVQSAVPALVALLREFSMVGLTDMGVTMRLGNDPVGKALVQIGKPSVGPVSQMLDQGNQQARWRAALVLANIGSPAAVQAIRNHIAKEKDPNVRRFMENLIHHQS